MQLETDVKKELLENIATIQNKIIIPMANLLKRKALERQSIIGGSILAKTDKIQGNLPGKPQSCISQTDLNSDDFGVQLSRLQSQLNTHLLEIKKCLKQLKIELTAIDEIKTELTNEISEYPEYIDYFKAQIASQKITINESIASLQNEAKNVQNAKDILVTLNNHMGAFINVPEEILKINIHEIQNYEKNVAEQVQQTQIYFEQLNNFLTATENFLQLSFEQISKVAENQNPSNIKLSLIELTKNCQEKVKSLLKAKQDLTSVQEFLSDLAEHLASQTECLAQAQKPAFQYFYCKYVNNNVEKYITTCEEYSMKIDHLTSEFKNINSQINALGTPSLALAPEKRKAPFEDIDQDQNQAAASLKKSR